MSEKMGTPCGAVRRAHDALTTNGVLSPSKGAVFRRGGFTLIEIAAALAVLSVVMALVIQLLAFSRAAARSNAETRLAASIAQGTLERLRGMAPEELAYRGGIDIALPPEAARLRDAKLTATARPWRGDSGLRHVRVVLRWRSSRNREREVVREGLASDHRAR